MQLYTQYDAQTCKSGVFIATEMHLNTEVIYNSDNWIFGRKYDDKIKVTDDLAESKIRKELFEKAI